jgi:ubiquinone/menaquinone biosynthesis C-methylase UbiE
MSDALRNPGVQVSPFLELGERLESARRLLNPKRQKAQAPFDRWHSYYAGYSYTFAKETLRVVAEKTPLTVLDPWNGSGTTLAAAKHLGHNAIGVDLNPATLTIAEAKTIDCHGGKRAFHLLSSTIAYAKSCKVHPESHALYEWLPGDLASFSIHAFSWLKYQQHSGYSTSEVAAATICLLKPLRAQALHQTSNPVWSKPSHGEESISISALEEKALKACLDIRADVEQIPCTEARTEVLLGDARSLAIPSESIDVVLSSPPYCTRIDYAKQTGFEMAALSEGLASDAATLRSSLMGTTCIRKQERAKVVQPESVRSLLAAIQGHCSQHSSGYYYKNLLQYFNDASLGVSEIARVLKPGGKALLVLQDSYYKEIHIPLSSLYCDIARAHGLLADVVLAYPVTRTMTSINTRSRKYLSTRSYSEDVILLWKN